MDHLLLDIKNFLKKLETGQLEIEAGQWELHKDLTNVKETIADISNLKKDVEEMKLNNVEAMMLIKGLENKLEAIGVVEEEPTIISENSEEYEEIYKAPKNDQNNPKGFKKRKCHRIVSEKIIEITSDMDSNRTKAQKKDSSEPESFVEAIKSNELAAGNKAETLYQNDEQKMCSLSDNSFLKKKRRTRKPDGAIMERYLNDAAKYRYRPSSHSMDNKKPAINNSICASTIKPEPVPSTFRDEKKGVDSQQKRNRPPNTLQKVTRKESILPKQFFCSRCPKSFAFKTEFSKHNKYAHENPKPKYYCRTCKKFYDKKCKMKNHLSMYLVKIRHSKATAYKCSYCNKTSSSPEQLTAHLKRCRIISKAKSKRKKSL